MRAVTILGLCVLAACGPSSSGGGAATAKPAPLSDPAACKAGDGEACVRVADAHLAKGDEPGALQIYKRACKAHAAAGCQKLEAGLGKHCDAGDLPSCNSLAFHYDSSGDHARALPLYEKVCKGGAMAGCVNLGFLYENGQGATQDFDRARTLYQQACDGGDMDGCGNLAALYFTGSGVKRDLPQAATLLARACDKDHGPSCKALGDLYAAGMGVAKDGARAAELGAKACKLGVQEACP